MTYTYIPRGVCARQMKIELDGNVIKKVEILGGCSGNLQGISSLVVGMTVEHAVERMKGIRCGFKSTSCPDQLSIALTEAMKQA